MAGRDILVPATSKAQQKAAGAALAAKRGEEPGSSSRRFATDGEFMSDKQLEDFAGAKRNGLPAKMG